MPSQTRKHKRLSAHDYVLALPPQAAIDEIEQRASQLTDDELATFLQKCSAAYHNTSNALVSDAVYDVLEDCLRTRCPDHPFLHSVGAAVATTAQHGVATNGTKRNVTLPYWMGSLDKIYPQRDEDRFQRWCAAHPATRAHPHTCSVKLDGVSGMLVVRPPARAGAKLTVHLFSRGDGRYGSDWSRNLRHMATLREPLRQVMHKMMAATTAADAVPFAVRGELIIPRDVFAAHAGTYATARAMVNGLLGAHRSPKPELLAQIRFVCYEMLDAPWHAVVRKFPGLTVQLDEMDAQGFDTVQQCGAKRWDRGNPTMQDLESWYHAWRASSAYDMDGVVVCVDQYTRNAAGNPDYAFAFKVRAQDQVGETVVTDVEWAISKDRYLKPTVVYAPIEIGGATFQRATGFHYKFIRDHCIGPGARVRIVRSGDVIPKVEAVLAPASSSEPLLPAQPHTLSASGIDAIADGAAAATEDGDFAQAALLFFFKTLKVHGVSRKMVARFVEHGFTDPLVILVLPAEALVGWSGVQQKTATATVASMQRAMHDATIEQWIVASNCLGRGMGVRRVHDVLQRAPWIVYPHDDPRVASAIHEHVGSSSSSSSGSTFASEEDALCAALRPVLIATKGFQSTTIHHICEHLPQLRAFWNRLHHAFPEVVTKLLSTLDAAQTADVAASDDAAAAGALAGTAVLLTGFRDAAIVQRLTAEGASVATTVAQASLVLCKDHTCHNKKTSEAQRRGIPLRTKHDWEDAAQHNLLKTLFANH